MAENVLSGLAMADDLPDELPRNRFWLKCGVAILVLVFLGLAVQTAYKRWEPRRLAKQGRVYFEQGKIQEAVLTARHALQINPVCEPAMRLMADITEKLKLAETVDWRRHVAEFNKGSADDALAWAQAALRAGRIATAEQALDAVPDAGRNTGRYHAAAGATAMSAGRLSDAEHHFSEAVRLDPANDVYRYNLATFQIQSGDAAKRAAGSQLLEELGKSARVDVYAKRSRLKQLRSEKNDAEALRVSGELVQLPAATFSDRLDHLQLLHKLQRPEWQEALVDLQKRAADASGDDAAALATWLRAAVGPQDALGWLDSVPANLAEQPVVRIARAECLTQVGDWAGLRTLVADGNWESLDFMRLAYFARALREQGDATGATARWSAAIGTARRREPLSRLAWTASQWGWKAELRDTLWAAVNTPAPQWALQMLHRAYLSDGDTGGLLRVAQKAAELDPNNDAARNNVAALSLLLGRDVSRATEIARQLHEKSPADPGFASTYALALHLAGRSAEALAPFGKLKPEKLKEPSVAAYYGIILAATGARDQASEYLALGEKAPLLPEEKALLATARGTLAK